MQLQRQLQVAELHSGPRLGPPIRLVGGCVSALCSHSLRVCGPRVALHGERDQAGRLAVLQLEEAGPLV